MRGKPNSVAKSRRSGQRLCKAGWGLFALSMFLPAVHVALGCGWVYGWECFRAVWQFLWGAIWGAAPMGWYYAGFAVMNGIMLVSPLVLVCKRRDRKRERRMAWLMMAATAYTFSLPFQSGLVFLGPGYYVWQASFWLVAAGALKLSAKLPAAPKPGTAELQRAYSPEEMVARRELEDYLRAV